jgi:hypothetical protein
MATNPTLYLEWNQDFLITPSGGLQTAVGWTSYRQRCVRRFITNPAQTLPDGTMTPADYVFVPTFGEGLGSLVDQPESDDGLADIERRITNGVLQDPDTSTTVPPNIIFEQPTPAQLNIFISVSTISGLNGTIALGGQ